MNESSKNLESYCGSCCDVCELYRGSIKKTIENLRRFISSYSFDKITVKLANLEPTFQHYAEFENVLESIDHLFKNLTDCPGCVANGGDESCVIRECCKKRVHISCIECIEMDTCKELITTSSLHHRCKTLKDSLKIDI